MIPTIGRIVHFRIGGTDEYPVLRPAFVVNAFGDDRCNLAVDLDPMNDSAQVAQYEAARAPTTSAPLVQFASLDTTARSGALDYPVRLYAYSAARGDGLGEWRWPEVKAAKPAGTTTP